MPHTIPNDAIQTVVLYMKRSTRREISRIKTAILRNTCMHHTARKVYQIPISTASVHKCIVLVRILNESWVYSPRKARRGGKEGRNRMGKVRGRARRSVNLLSNPSVPGYVPHAALSLSTCRSVSYIANHIANVCKILSSESVGRMHWLSSLKPTD